MRGEECASPPLTSQPRGGEACNVDTRAGRSLACQRLESVWLWAPLLEAPLKTPPPILRLPTVLLDLAPRKESTPLDTRSHTHCPHTRSSQPSPQFPPSPVSCRYHF